MKFKIEVSSKAEKFLEKLRDKTLQRRLVSGMEALSENPFPVQSKKLSGFETRYRIRVGDYRIIYQVDQGVLTVLVLTIGHRREVYR